MAQEEFTIKEVVIEIKEDLKAFRNQYDVDQQKRDDEISKRPTRGELYGSVGAVGIVVGIVVSLTGS